MISSALQQSTLKGYSSNATTPIMAVVSKTEKDTEKPYICGQLNSVGYDLNRLRLYLVPVNGATIDAAGVKTTLNNIYKQAAIEWDVEYSPKELSLTLTPEELAAVCANIDATALSNYSPGMLAALKKLDREPDANNYELFIINGTANGVKGFMPLNRSAGFIFTGGCSVAEVQQTIAHELGHGAFGLEHVGKAAGKTATDNLMDYTSSTALDKPQWDLIHGEHRRLTWFQGEEEGKNQYVDDPVCFQKKLEYFRWVYANNEYGTFNSDGYPFFGHSASSITLLNNKIYPKIDARFLTTVQFYPWKLSPVKSDDHYKYLYKNTNGGLAIEFNVTCDDDKTRDSFTDYLFPSLDDFNSQMDLLRSKISNCGSKENLMELLAILPEAEYFKLTIEQRVKCLDVIAKNTMILTADYVGCVNDMEICFNLIKGLENKSDKVALLNQLVSSNFLNKLITSFSGEKQSQLVLMLAEYLYAVKDQPDFTYLSSQQFIDNSGTYTKLITLEDAFVKKIFKSSRSLNGNYVISSYNKVGTVANSSYSFDVEPYGYVPLLADVDYPEYNLKSGQQLVVPGFFLDYILNGYNNQEMVNDIVAMADIGVSIMTAGVSSTSKIAANIGTKMTINMAVEVAAQASIMALDPKKKMSNIINEMNYSNIVWSGFSSFVSDSETKEALGCLRTGIKLYLKPNVKFEDAIIDGSSKCISGIVVGFVTKNYLIPSNGYLNKLFEKTFNDNPEGVFATLRSFGISNKEIISATQGFSSKILKATINNLVQEYEKK